jgi:mono/diheme cytochrome c family protein
MPRALMPNRTVALLAFSFSALPSVVLADAALFESKGCVSCHGVKGQGIPGLAPPLKGSPFVTSSSAAEIKATIIKGRVGANRRHTNIPGGMPGVAMDDADAESLVKYLKGDLQK